MWKYLECCRKYVIGVPRGPKKREARIICHICYIANPEHLVQTYIILFVHFILRIDKNMV